MLNRRLVNRKAIHEAAGQAKSKSKLLSAKFFKKQIDKMVKATVQGAAKLGENVHQAADSMSVLLKLDSRGRQLALIEKVNEEMQFVRSEFSSFTITWAPIMERALNYLGDKNLNKVKFRKDELCHRRDALHSLAFGFEFIKLCIAWRENLLVAHEAYKLYLETVKRDLVESQRIGNKTTVDEDFIFQLRTIHNYMLLTAWMGIDEVALEPRMKLDYLMLIEDDQVKNYESEYFRNIVVLQEIYEPTIREFDCEEREVVEAMGQAGALTEDFEDVDRFFGNFRHSLAEHEVRDVDWKVPKELEAFLHKLAPELQYNRLVYTESFLEDLKRAKEEARAEGD